MTAPDYLGLIRPELLQELRTVCSKMTVNEVYYLLLATSERAHAIKADTKMPTTMCVAHAIHSISKHGA